MRILFLTTAYPGLTERGYGIGTAVSHTTSALAEKGHEVHVLCATGRRKTSELGGVVCHEFALGDHQFHRANPYSERAHQLYLHSDLHLAELYQHWCEYVDIVNGGFEPDIIDSPDYKALGYFFVYHRLLGYQEAFAPILTSCHSNQFLMFDLDRDLTYSWSNMELRQREKYQLVGADNRLTVSKFMADRISARFHVSRPHVYYTCSPHARPENLLPPCDNNELLYFGQLSYLKGLLSLLRVAAYMWDEGQSFVLKLMGTSQWYAAKDTDMATYIRKEYADYVARGQLKIYPHAGNFETIKSVLSQSRAMVHPSLMESLSHTCIEAMSYGRPVVASNQGGHTELVEHGASGFVYSNDQELELYLKRVLRATPSELEGWGTNANRRVCDLVSVEKSLPVYEEICKDTIHRGRSGSRKLFPNSAFADKRRFAVIPTPEAERNTGESLANLLHVIIPCFNHGKFLEHVLDSILGSTYRPILLTIIDDASTDPQAREEFTLLEKRFRPGAEMEIQWVRELRNIGPAATRSKWGRSSNAEFLCFVDADDKVRPEYFERAIGVLKRYENVGFVGGWIETFGKSSFSWIIADVDFPLFLLRNQTIGPSVIRRCAWQGQALQTVGEDHDAYLSMVEKGWIGVNLPETVYDYRVQPCSLYHSATTNEFRGMMALIANRHQHLYQIFAEDVVGILAQNYLFGPLRHKGRLARWKSARACQVKSTIRFFLAHPRMTWRLPLVLAKLFIPEGFGR